MVGELVPQLHDSSLSLTAIALSAGDATRIGSADDDSLVYVHGGSGSLTLGKGEHALAPRTAALVLAGEEAAVESADELHAFVAAVGPGTDLHAPIGPRETICSLEDADSERATGARSFQILFGPHNGSTRATLFAGYIPPGKAPWHYHLYDEIVWVPEGPGRLHIGETTTDLGPGSAFRLRPRQVHIVENLTGETMTVIGVFTPAGSPSAAYLMPDVAAEYRFSD